MTLEQRVKEIKKVAVKLHNLLIEADKEKIEIVIHLPAMENEYSRVIMSTDYDEPLVDASMGYAE